MTSHREEWTDHRVAAGAALTDGRLRTGALRALLAIHDLLDRRLPRQVDTLLKELLADPEVRTGYEAVRDPGLICACGDCRDLTEPSVNVTETPEASSEGAAVSSENDPDEALAKVLLDAWLADDRIGVDFGTLARAAREHIETEDAKELRLRELHHFEEEQKRVKAEAERDDMRDGRDHWQEAAKEDRDRADKAGARHEVLREEVEDLRNAVRAGERRLRADGLTIILNHDDERGARVTPPTKPATVTLSREGLTESVVLGIAANDLRRNYSLGWAGLPKSLPDTLERLADAMDGGDQS